MSVPLAYFLTWTTYGTWLPGDDRGWIDRHSAGIKTPDPARQSATRSRMSESIVELQSGGRQCVDTAIRGTCLYRDWTVHELNVRSNHVHAIIAAENYSPSEVLRVLKSYATRDLNLLYSNTKRKHWWTRGGSKKYLNDEKSLHAAIQYVRNQ